ncbi:MAG TPA: HAMP domain-containing sensor histidine kinase [Solirubrobacteraceae bacterium]|jgi:two-component system sensor histidine kinase BaeS|nr:HAMP domain-containing sensor histidine kinase [Solirubrobacteraceae bacterium]
MSLRRRVFAFVAGTAIAACVLTVAVAAVLVRARVADQRLVALIRQANVVALVGGAPGALSAGEHVYRVDSGRPRAVPVPRALRIVGAIHDLSDSEGDIQVGAQSLIYAARGTARGGIVLVRGAGLAFAEWRPFLASLVLAGIGGALLAGVASFLLARRLVRPITVLSDATTRVAAGEERVDVPVAGDDELAQLARSFNLMSDSLARAREQQREFLESVSHELKTPLTSIRGYAEGLGDGAVAPAQASAVIGAEAGRLERLVSDLLDLARLQRAGFAVEREPVDLSNVVERALERHRLRARELNVALTGSHDGPAPGVGDPDRLLQATSNLIENALRITPAGGAVTATARAGEISVQDTGPGLAPEDLPRAFERFYLYERYRSEREVGSGLGLAIVGELAARMGGGISVENVDGGGARFTLRVPQP